MIDDRLPNAAAARVDTRKLGEYLLNPAHPDNGGKAAFFVALGFVRSDVEPLRSALVRLAAEGTLTRRIVPCTGRSSSWTASFGRPPAAKPWCERSGSSILEALRHVL